MDDHETTGASNVSPDSAAGRLVASLGLGPHPEGGYFREIGRGTEPVVAPGRGRRSAWTLIWFLLPAGQVSRWHRVASDETWTHLLGAPLELATIGEGDTEPTRLTLGPLGDDRGPVGTVERGRWQAARSLGEFTVVSCFVAPGFEFEDFRMLRDDGETRRRLEPVLGDLVTLV